jgi:hypothetical protein
MFWEGGGKTASKLVLSQALKMGAVGIDLICKVGLRQYGADGCDNCFHRK